MQPLKVQKSPAPLPLGLQSPSVRAAMPPSQGTSRQPYAQGGTTQSLSYKQPSEHTRFDNAQSMLPTVGGSSMKPQCTVTTGMPFSSSSSSLSAHSVPQAPFSQSDATGHGFLGTQKLQETVAPVASVTTGVLSMSGLGHVAGAFAPQSSSVKPVTQLPLGAVDMPHGGGHIPSFMDSVAAFAEGFALSHCTETESLNGWGFGNELNHKHACTVDAAEIAHYESGLNASDLSDETSEQIWRVPEDMLLDSTSVLEY